MNLIKSKRSLGLFLFIDFKKAFDTVDQRLLLFKLSKYGFDEKAIGLLSNYFDNRRQYVKIYEYLSEPRMVELGVPQGSVLGPLLFLIFINDLVIFIKDFKVKLFADDTTLIKTGNEINELIKSFIESSNQLLDWCKFNRIDINWSKTKIMFVTNKRKIGLPSTVEVNGNLIEVVDNFKLLGVVIDNRLNFLQHVSELRTSINKRIHSINRLFFLAHKVKLQFFKSFILPFFDYCSSLLIYFPKRAIQKMANSYNFCLYKLLNVRCSVFKNEDFNQLNNELSKHNIENFQHRIIKRLSRFIYKILNVENSPAGLKMVLINKCTNQNVYSLRNNNEFVVPFKGKFNDFKEKTFDYFYSKFINNFLLNDINCNYILFCHRINNNINLIFTKFCKIFVNLL